MVASIDLQVHPLHPSWPTRSGTCISMQVSVLASLPTWPDSGFLDALLIRTPIPESWSPCGGVRLGRPNDEIESFAHAASDHTLTCHPNATSDRRRCRCRMRGLRAPHCARKRRRGFWNLHPRKGLRLVPGQSPVHLEHLHRRADFATGAP